MVCGFARQPPTPKNQQRTSRFKRQEQPTPIADKNAAFDFVQLHPMPPVPGGAAGTRRHLVNNLREAVTGEGKHRGRISPRDGARVGSGERLGPGDSGGPGEQRRRDR